MSVKSCAVAICLAMVLIGCGGGSSGDDTNVKSVKAPESDFEVKPADDKKSVEITKYTGSGGISIIIPAKIQGMPVSRIGDRAFYESIIIGAVIPEGVTEIGNEAFYGSTISNVTLPSSLKSIGDKAFKDCAALTSITIPNNVTSIGSSAFSGCSGLMFLTIGSSVTKIGNDAFEGCGRNLQYIISLNPTLPPKIGKAFENLKDILVLVPQSSLDTYRTDNEWQYLLLISDIESAPIKNGRPHGKVTIKLDNDKEVYTYRDGIRHGQYEAFHENGEKAASGNFVNGKEDGKFEAFYEDGKTQIVENYKDGKLDGKVEVFHENGKLASTGNFVNGKEDGKFEDFHEDGKTWIIRNYKNGKLDGKYEEFHENGKLAMVIHFNNGKPDGEVKEYDKNGKIVRAINVKYEESERTLAGSDESGVFMFTAIYGDDGRVTRFSHRDRGISEEKNRLLGLVNEIGFIMMGDSEGVIFFREKGR